MNTDDDILERPAAAEDETCERLRIRVRRKLPGRRLDKYLSGRLPHLSRTTIQRLIREGAIKINDKPTKASYEICGGDIVDLLVPAPEKLEIVPENIPLEILYEDDALIAINKPTGIICHPARAEQRGTIVNALAYYASTLSTGCDPFRPGVVHRLDKNTTGVMLVAKADESHWRLGLQFERRTVQKTYLAVVEGTLNLDGDMVDAPIGVHPVVREKFAVFLGENSIDLAKQAVTYYEVAERFRGYTLVKLFPKTGRTHQLRVHMSWIRHPIVGDTMYGGKLVSEKSLTGEGSETPIYQHQALHAWKINFRHPISEKRMEIEAPLPEPMRRLVTLLRETRSV